jgi:hypothetical protein
MQKRNVFALAVLLCGSLALAGCDKAGDRQTSGNNERGSSSGTGSATNPQGPTGPSSPQKNPSSTAR